MNEKAFDLKNFIIQVVGDVIEGANKVFSFNEEEIASYKVLLTRFIDTNGPNASTIEKGKSLEEIVAYIIEKSVVFETIQNVRTSSNEIDHLVRLNQMGNVFKSQGLLSFEDKLLAECKNYDGSISVTWVGKFFSLMTYTKNHLGIIFSFHGLSGPNWRNAEGLVKKLFLAEGVKIIDFNIKDFKRIANGESFIKIINDKVFTLESDTSFKHLIEKHPNQSKF